MKILLHMCCAPCAIYPLERLRSDQNQVMGYFFGSNIHPSAEYLRRREAVVQYGALANLEIIYEKTYGMEDFIRQIVFRETQRCRICYHLRLNAAAHIAKRGKFDAFTTSLLYSKFQRHDEIKAVGEAVGKEVGVRFHYEDFRPGWQEGIQKSKALGLYRQPYCGCIYSEKERFLCSRIFST